LCRWPRRRNARFFSLRETQSRSDAAFFVLDNRIADIDDDFDDVSLHFGGVTLHFDDLAIHIL
jgi:hypothetical protein